MRAVLWLFFLIAVPAVAQVEVKGDLDFFSDYRDRGLSLSDTGVAGQAGLEAGGTRFFGGAVLGYAQDLEDRDLQARFYTGYSRFVANAYDLTLSATLDSFHETGSDGGGSEAWFEARAAISRDVGLFYARAGLAVAPDGRWSDPQSTVIYPFVELQVPIPRLPALTFVGEVGYTVATDGPDRADWKLGLTGAWKDFELFAGYTDTSTGTFSTLGRATGLVELRYYF